MAAVFGVVANGAGLAGAALQVTEAICTLTRTCQDMRDAPSELKNMVLELEMTGQIVRSLYIMAPPTAFDAILLRDCLSHCDRAMKDLLPVLKELQANTTTHGLRSSFQMVLKADRTRNAIEQLNQSRLNLLIALCAYMTSRISELDTNSERRHQQVLNLLINLGPASPPLQAIQHRLDQHTRLLQELSAEQARSQVYNVRAEASGRIGFGGVHDTPDLTCSTVVTRVPPKGKNARTSVGGATRLYGSAECCRRKTPYEIAVCTLKFLARMWTNILRFSTNHATYGWDVSLHCRRLISKQDQRWSACLNGDIEGVKQLLKSNELTMHDEDEDGATMFTLAISRDQAELARWLYQQGCASAATLTMGDVPSLYAVDSKLEQSGCILQEIIKKCKRQDDVADELLDIWGYPFAAWNDTERFHAIWYAGFFECVFDPFLDLTSDPSAARGKGFYEAHGSGGATMMHVIGTLWGLSFLKNQPADHAPEATHWAGRLTEAALTHADLHAEYQHKRSKWRDHACTPLVAFIGVLATDATIEPPSEKALTLHLRDWIIALKQANVDLAEYGKVEAPYVARSLQTMYRPTVICMTYGPSPNDWRFFERHRGDIYAGVFWDMVEHYGATIPEASLQVVRGWDISLEEDWHNAQLSLRRARKRATSHRQHQMLSRGGIGGVHDIEAADETFSEPNVRGTKQTSGFRPTFDYLHLDGKSGMRYVSLQASKISKRQAVLPSP
ncbi:hypothetical protein LTR56_004799 [Elasticomyces elasticus]|nr:hypothetical protein LTR56_004799 [Elasticomyces elasticus]KAK3665655.1 hypothetical protein LTR22_003595 [Elasticomyces elasticus]KAK4930307.1 hypothetical protein LTR49_003048 [Elasticomyces elasticus]KAK5749958.1 hypothetical protein LTS12_019967 [Elasticomyces elasticus]